VCERESVCDLTRCVAGMQNKVDDNAMHILSLLDNGGCFYVCGNTIMARDVKKALMQALVR